MQRCQGLLKVVSNRKVSARDHWYGGIPPRCAGGPLFGTAQERGRLVKLDNDFLLSQSDCLPGWKEVHLLSLDIGRCEMTGNFLLNRLLLYPGNY